MATHSHHHAHHAYHSHHDHINSDYGPMYELDWIKGLLHHIGICVRSHASWMGLSPDTSHRVLDYACGDGVVSRSLITRLPKTTFQGLDLSTSQVHRFNQKAKDMLGEQHDERRLFAIQGDIMQPSATLDQPEWHDFDVAIVSMALHHMQDPIAFLKTLRKRLRKGGIVVVIDWLHPNPVGEVDDNNLATKYDPSSMITVPNGNLKIWPGFSRKGIVQDFKVAGYINADVVEYSERIETPEEMKGCDMMFIAKATVP